MQQNDEIAVEILSDGTVKSTTPRVSAGNHGSAADFFKLLQRTTGGEQTTSKRNKAHEGRTHAHDQQKAGQ